MSTAIATPTVIELPIPRLPELARYGAQFFAEGKLPGRFVPDVFVATWTKLITARLGIVIALESGDELLGGLGAMAYPDPNDGALIATELFWYIRQGHRGGGFHLLNTFEAWARRNGCKRIAMVHLTTLMPAVLERVYTARGYRHVESHYMKEA